MEASHGHGLGFLAQHHYIIHRVWWTHILVSQYISQVYCVAKAMMLFQAQAGEARQPLTTKEQFSLVDDQDRFISCILCRDNSFTLHEHCSCPLKISPETSAVFCRINSALMYHKEDCKCVTRASAPFAAFYLICCYEVQIIFGCFGRGQFHQRQSSSLNPKMKISWVFPSRLKNDLSLNLLKPIN